MNNRDYCDDNASHANDVQTIKEFITGNSATITLKISFPVTYLPDGKFLRALNQIVKRALHFIPGVQVSSTY